MITIKYYKAFEITASFNFGQCSEFLDKPSNVYFVDKIEHGSNNFKMDLIIAASSSVMTLTLSLMVFKLEDYI